MKAIVCAGKGTLDPLTLKEVEKPVVRDNEVLVKILAATVTPSDIEGMGLVLISRPFRNFSRQHEAIPGVEFAGVIEATGKAVRQYKAGDQVFGSAGTSFGAWAEYICLPEDGALAPMPSTMSFSEAAGLCDGALTALHFLLNKAKIANGQSVLINGASGSVGTYAVQLAKYFGCNVTGVCGTGNIELVKTLGADRVIDYTKENIARSRQTYDIIFDAIGKSSYAQCKMLLKPGGTYLTTVPSPAIFLQMLWTRMRGGKKAVFTATGLAKRGIRIKALHLIRALAETGKLTSVVDRRYPLEQISEALRYVAQGHKKGNVILSPEYAISTLQEIISG